MPDGEDIFLRDLRRSVERCDEEAANPVNVAAIRAIKPLVVRGKWLSSYGGRLTLSGRHNAMHDWKCFMEMVRFVFSCTCHIWKC